MKKIVLFSLIALFCIVMVGCGKKGESSVIKELTKKIEKSSGYHIVGTLEMISNEDNYIYDVDVSYEKEDKFRVSLKNQTNSHEQIILKNEEGVYVLTPSLNKSFKFQSEWPYNNSQSYLLQPLLKDIKSDKEKKFKENENGYTITTKVNYSNNKNLTKQVIYLDKNVNVKEVHILDEEDRMHIKMTYKKIDWNKKFDKKYFDINKNMEMAVVDENLKTVSKLNDVVFPMYLPINTTLSSQDKLEVDHGERVIMTFDGEKPFMLVQETAVRENEFTTIPVDGEPVILSGTVGIISDSLITWVNEGIEYHVVSDVLSDSDLLEVAKSISVMPVGK